ncbi:RNA polymerase III transcription initiation factor complex subunit [Maudiozyma exigua]|uniref:RNA polymerase III transcription initiation factor complex subunit n=1 Tax=Maudiozyma exigua TaxID=34358 RepID=A0A9P7B551_MAUEX|nr:RNA polymerase III transcription initiation factor complex subunit [Kazachstania exigua]
MAAMSSTIYPDELVSKLLEEIAYNKGEIKLTQLWDIAKTFVNTEDELIRGFVFLSLISNSDIIIHQDKKEIKKPTSYADVKEIEDTISIALSEDKLWTILTGYTKKESSIGDFAFALLLEIAKAKEKGINTMFLVKATNQDPRSITGRLKKLDAIVVTKQVIYKGHLMKEVTMRKFQNDQPETKTYVNMRQHLGTIVDIVKKSKNGIREIGDLRRELKFDKEKRLIKAFNGAMRYLSLRGSIQKIMVISPKNPNIKVRCVKYLQDYTEENKSNTSNDLDDTSDDDDDMVDGEDDGNVTRQEEDDSENNDYVSAASILQDQGIIVEDKDQANIQELQLNRFFPLQSQTYDLAAGTGINGISTMKASNILVGRDFKKSFAKGLEYYAQTAGKTKLDESSMNLLKIYDFEGKKKFYRLFTEENFKKMTDPTNPYKPPHLSALKVQKQSLEKLNKKNFVPLNNTVRYGRDADGNEVFFWHGTDMSSLTAREVKKAPKSNKKKRNEKGNIAEEDTPKPKRIKQIEVPEVIKQIGEKENEYLVELTEPKDKVIATGKRGLQVDGFFATSLKSIKRQRALLDVLSKMGGVAYMGEHLYDELSKALDSNTVVDKKTVHTDVGLLTSSRKLLVRRIPDSKRKLVYLPGLSEDDLDAYMNKEKNKKKNYLFSSTLHTSDLYFFDKSAKEHFNRTTKSVQRLRAFQNKSKEGGKIKEKPSEKPPRKPRKIKNKDSNGQTRKRKASLFAELSNGIHNKENHKQKVNTKKLTFHVGKKAGLEALIMAVVITKSITNEIQWDKISLLFPKNSLDNLKKKWTARRVRMGHSGWKAHVDKWQRILVQAIKNETVSLQDAENVNLPILIPLWISFEENKNSTSASLYRDYDTNIKRYTFVKESPQHYSQMGLMMSSMVQRETFLLKSTFVYHTSPVEKSEESKVHEEENVKTVIRSILIDKSETGKDEIELLKSIPKEELDRIVLDMAKSKQIILRGTKLEASPLIVEMLESKGSYTQFSNAIEYTDKVNELLSSENGIIINQEISDVAAWQLIDLVQQRKVSLHVIPVERAIGNFHYTTRTFEIETLTPPLICRANKSKLPLSTPITQVAVPLGAPYSALWIDSKGQLRENVWKHVVAFVMTETLFSPGILINRLVTCSYNLLSERELQDVCDWLAKKGLLEKVPFHGFIVTPKWYKLLM